MNPPVDPQTDPHTDPNKPSVEPDGETASSAAAELLGRMDLASIGFIENQSIESSLSPVRDRGIGKQCVDKPSVDKPSVDKSSVGDQLVGKRRRSFIAIAGIAITGIAGVAAISTLIFVVIKREVIVDGPEATTSIPKKVEPRVIDVLPERSAIVPTIESDDFFELK